MGQSGALFGKSGHRKGRTVVQGVSEFGRVLPGLIDYPGLTLNFSKYFRAHHYREQSYFELKDNPRFYPAALGLGEGTVSPLQSFRMDIVPSHAL